MLGIVGLVLAFFVAPLGVIVSAIGRKTSKDAGFSTGLATAGLVLSSLFTAGWLIGMVILGVVLSGAAATCAELGPGEHVVDGASYTCG